MRFRDAVLLRLLDADARDSLFDDVAAEALARAAYATDLLPLDPPFTAIAERVEPGLVLTSPTRGNVLASLPNQATPITAQVELSGLPEAGPVVVDALWHGSVSAVGAAVPGRVEEVRGGLTGPDAGALKLRFEPIGDASPSAMTLAVTAAVLIDDPDDPARDLGSLLARARRARTALATLRQRPASAPGRAAPRTDIPIVFVLPEARLDDTIWPGASAGASATVARAQRLARANGWASDMGIVLIASAGPQ